MNKQLIFSLLLVPALSAMAMPLPAQGAEGQKESPGPLTLEAAIRRAWTGQPGLQAGEAMVDRARSEADAMRDLNLPTVSLSAGLLRTDQPMMAFGMKLNQARIAQMDFNPAALNKPDAITGIGGGLTMSQPLYTGGRLTAARKAGSAMADAEVANQSHRRQQVALAVVQAYFGAQVAEQGKVYAEDSLRQAREVERFVQARVDQGLMLKAEGMRIRAYRAQAEAGVAEARQRVASARSALALLTGMGAAPVTLATSLTGESTPLAGGAPGTRGDLQAAKFQWQAAQEGAKAAKGSLLPEVGLNLGLGTMRNTWSSGGNWSEVSLGFKWNVFSAPDRRRVSSAKAMERAASYNLRWQEQVAGREASEAQLAIESASARIKMAQEALEASESVRTLRQARHREGLLPLTEVLDAEAGLSGARTLLLNSQYELRVSRAQLSLAQGQPIEGVQ
ncbi:MAG: TolC family protein [Holophagaceae bacterium]|nr:TolC family protein [Holophagaceae bacterium]